MHIKGFSHALASPLQQIIGGMIGLLWGLAPGTLLGQSDSQTVLDSLHAQLQQATDTEQQVSLLIGMGNEWLGSREMDSSLVYFERAFALSEQTGFWDGMARSKASIANAYSRLRDYETSVQHFESIQPYFENVSDPELVSKILYNHCRQLMYSNQYVEAIQVGNQGVEYAVEHERFMQAGKIRNVQGNVCNYQADYKNAITYYQQAVNHFEQAEFWEGYGGVMMNIGILYNRMYETEKGIESYQKALQIFQQEQLTPRMIQCLNAIAVSYRDAGNHELALDYFDQAIEVALEADPLNSLANIYSNLGELYLAQKNFEKAESVLTASLELANEHKKRTTIIDSHLRLGALYVQTGKLTLAEKHLKAAFELNQEVEDLSVEGEIRMQFSELYKNRGQIAQAFEEYKLAMEIEDSLFRSEKALEISGLMLEYEVERKEKEIVLLEKDNKLKALEISQQRKNFFIGIWVALLFLGAATFFFFQQKKLRATKGRLEVSLTEKETLLKEIHHRVKNNLQLIMSLLNLQADEDQEQTIEDFLYKGQNRVKSMALIHEQLYRSDNIAAINMREYLEQLVASIFEAYDTDDIHYQIRADEVQLDIDKAIPLGLIVNELVNNSLKHAFNKNGTGSLAVNLHQKREEMEVVVQDDGSGFQSTQQQESMGLQLVRVLVQQLKGTFDLQEHPGTTARILFPIPLST